MEFVIDAVTLHDRQSIPSERLIHSTAKKIQFLNARPLSGLLGRNLCCRKSTFKKMTNTKRSVRAMTGWRFDLQRVTRPQTLLQLNDKPRSIRGLRGNKASTPTCAGTAARPTTWLSSLILCRNVQSICCSEKVALSPCQRENSAGILTGSCHGNRRLLPNSVVIA